jgi:hypothetical protein
MDKRQRGLQVADKVEDELIKAQRRLQQGGDPVAVLVNLLITAGLVIVAEAKADLKDD